VKAGKLLTSKLLVETFPARSLHLEPYWSSSTLCRNHGQTFPTYSALIR
jgi:hypothetical protein